MLEKLKAVAKWEPDPARIKHVASRGAISANYTNAAQIKRT